jgi:pimeloyl-ACP methyl ester carboxylesterase
MRYIDNFDTTDDPPDQPLVIHRHGASPGRALLVLLHGLGGKRYLTWTPSGEDPARVGLAKFLYEDIEGIDIGLYAYVSGVGRIFSFLKSIPLEREAKVLADRIRDQSKVYRTVILAGHSMGGILAKAAICKLIERDDEVTLAAIRGLMLLATPQAGSLRVPRLIWNRTNDGRVLRAHGELITKIQRLFTDRVTADPNPTRPNLFVIPAFVVAAAEDNWVDEFSSGLNVSSDRTNNIRASHKTAVKPTTKTDDSYEWLRDRIREVVQAGVPPSSLVPADEQTALRNDLTQVLQSAFTYDALTLNTPQLGIRFASIGADRNTAHRSLVEWAAGKGRLRALARLMVEERPTAPGVQTFAEKHPDFGAFLTSDERELLRQCLADSSFANYAALRRFGVEAMLVDLNDFLPNPPAESDAAAAHVPALVRTADFVGQVEALVGVTLRRFPGPVVEGKLRPLLDALQSRRAKGGPSDSPFDACDLQGKLFINRAPFRQALRDLTADNGAIRVVAIEGPTRSGKSHSKFMIEYLERLGRYDKALISLEDDTPATFTPEVLIATIVRRTGGTDRNLNLKKTRSETKERWIKRLGDELLSHVNQRARAVFVVLDGFDQPSLRTDTRDLVQELLKRAATEARLRIALLGYQRDLLPQEVTGRVAAEPITGFSQDDLRRFFVQYARDRGKTTPAPAVVDVFVQDVSAAVPQNQPAPERNEAVAKAVEAWAERLRGLP